MAQLNRKTLITTAVTAMLLATGAHAQVSDDVVRIGVMADMTGPYAGNGGPGSTLAVRMAVEDFGGKVLGKPIEVLVADDQNKPDVGTNIARQWLEQQKVDAIVGGSASSIALSVSNMMKTAKKPYLIAGTVASDLTGKACSPMNIQFAVDTYSMPKAGVQSLMGQGIKTFYFIAVDYAFGAAFQAEATKFIEAAGGKVVGSVKHPLGTTDFSSYLMQAQASKAQAIVLLNAGAALYCAGVAASVSEGVKRAREAVASGRAAARLSQYVKVSNQFGSPRAMAAWEKAYAELHGRRGLSARPALLAISRGGLYATAWTRLHPDRVSVLLLDNAVCDAR